MKYPVIIYPCEEGGYVAEIPSLKGCLAQGETIEETLNELEEVFQLWIETAKKNNDSIPGPDEVLAKVKAVTG